MTLVDKELKMTEFEQKHHIVTKDITTLLYSSHEVLLHVSSYTYTYGSHGDKTCL